MRIFFDMDGVLCDFQGQCEREFDLKFPTERMPEEEFREWRNNLYQKIDASGSNWWYRLPRLKTADLVESEMLRKHDVHFLTAIPSHMDFGSPESIDVIKGKTGWIRHWYGPWGVNRLWITKAHLKQFYCASDKSSILIDDHETNIEQWPGIGILHKSYEQTENFLRQLLYV